MNASSWKRKDHVNSAEVQPIEETNNDAALAQVFEVCAVEIQSSRQPDD
jgi:hypothetical protein